MALTGGSGLTVGGGKGILLGKGSFREGEGSAARWAEQTEWEVRTA